MLWPPDFRAGLPGRWLTGYALHSASVDARGEVVARTNVRIRHAPRGGDGNQRLPAPSATHGPDGSASPAGPLLPAHRAGHVALTVGGTHGPPVMRQTGAAEDLPQGRSHRHRLQGD